MVLNRKQKISAKKARHDALVWLEKTFPAIFNTSIQIRPLKIGIMADIFAYTEQNNITTFSKSKLREAIVIFTRRMDYLTCLKAREKRVDLEGNIGDEVTEEEAERASQKIKKRVEKSAKNARKNAITKTPTQKSTAPKLPNYSHHSTSQPDFSAYYHSNHSSHASHSYNATSSASTKTPSPSVTVTRKTTRAYDPSAVARLKEKLGLSKKPEASSSDQEQPINNSLNTPLNNPIKEKTI